MHRKIYYTNGSVDIAPGMTKHSVIVNDDGNVVSGNPHYKNSFKYQEITEEQYAALGTATFKRSQKLERDMTAAAKVARADKAKAKLARAETLIAALQAGDAETLAGLL